MKLLFSTCLVAVSCFQAVLGKCLRRAQTCTVNFLQDFNFVDYTGCNFNRNIRRPLQALLREQGCTSARHWKNAIKDQSGYNNLRLAKKWVQGICEEQMVPQSCLSDSIASVGLATAGTCNIMNLRSLVEDAMKADCPHRVVTEVRLLYRDNHPHEYLKDGPEFDVAMTWLVQQCYSDFGCTTDAKGHRLRSCDTSSVIEEIADHMPADCPHSLEEELELITGTSEYKQYIHDMCADAWANMTINTEFTDIDSNFTTAFMDAHNKGLGYLNKETGNFKGLDDPAYPVSTQSLTTGMNIDRFFKATETPGSGNSVLRANFDSFDQCQNQAVMCCWGRDRQSGDDNGTCERGAGHCDNKSPSDNTNMCYSKDFSPYHKNLEDAVHCHGFMWGEDENDASVQLKMNLYFYIAMHDHLYTRGYVERIAETASSMCGCVEDMPVVTRADCSQVHANFNLRLTRDEEGLLSVMPNSMFDTTVLEVDFRACRGLRPDGFGNLVQRNNDLASKAREMYKEGKLSKDKMSVIFDTTLGHSALGNTARGAEGEEICRRSYCANAKTIEAGTYDCSV